MDEARAKRLKAALRDNLKRRKARAREAGAEGGKNSTSGDDPPGASDPASKPGES